MNSTTMQLQLLRTLVPVWLQDLSVTFINERQAHSRRKAAPWIHGETPRCQQPADKMLLVASIATSCTVFTFQCTESWQHYITNIKRCSTSQLSPHRCCCAC
jgi:hypothetical protein